MWLFGPNFMVHLVLKLPPLNTKQQTLTGYAVAVLMLDLDGCLMATLQRQLCLLPLLTPGRVVVPQPLCRSM